jgi:hypothetical protein
MKAVQEHTLDCDILIAGGGPAGVPCAIAAARNGAKVILCQDRPVLGGNASSEVRMHIIGADASGQRGAELATEAREGGIMDELRLEFAVRNPQRSASMVDLILFEKCKAESNLTVMLNTTVVSATVEDGRITQAVADRQSTEDRFFINADIFIDCTGDGRLGVEAGASYRHGREAKSEFDEPLAQDVADNKTLGSTIMFIARDMGEPHPFIAPPWARTFTDEDLRLRPHGEPGIDKGLEHGYWWAEWGGCLDTVKDGETIKEELLAIILGAWDHVKNGGDHGADNWALDWFGFVPGKRESRRFIGQHILREQDVMESRPQPDAIAYGGWPIDTHPPEGVDAPEKYPCTQHHVPKLYDIPLRSCVSADVKNLMFAGRNMSATHIAFASTRVMATCAAVGQGVGTAAARAIANKLAPNELSDNAEALHAIQQQLLRDDAYLIGVRNEDENDLAHSATVEASSEQADGPAAFVLSGQTRAVHGPDGAPADRARPGSHRWMSVPDEVFPAWLELRWDAPVPVKTVQLIFDTGLHRVLTLTHTVAYIDRMHWGAPQPETVKEYTIAAERDGDWHQLLRVENNYLRRRTHELPEPIETTALRITVEATQGIDHARILEVRVYS